MFRCVFLYINIYQSLSLWFFFAIQIFFFQQMLSFPGTLLFVQKSQQILITLKTKWLSQWLSVIHSLTHSLKLKKYISIPYHMTDMWPKPVITLSKMFLTKFIHYVSFGTVFLIRLFSSYIFLREVLFKQV